MENCPSTLPVQLLEDCLMYDVEWERFPASDYAYIDQYQAWLKTQQPKLQPNTVVAPDSKNIAAALK
jgi:hypothetical protein